MPFRRRLVALVLALGALVALPLDAQFDSKRAYVQSDAVRSRYPDPPFSFDTPGFRPGRTDFTSYEEMRGFITDLLRVTPHARFVAAGESQEGRMIPALVFSDTRANAANPQRLGRPVVMLVGLQHGNEPAGGEAMLVLANELAYG